MAQTVFTATRETPAPAPDNTNWMGGLPIWARFAMMIGFPAAAFGWYLYAIAPRLEAMEKAVTAMNVAVAQSTQQQRDAFFISQRICINTAKTDADKVACVSLTTPR